MKIDEFSNSRGGWSRILDISCEYGHHVCYYQKDGPGPLKRLYIDRIIGLNTSDKTLECPKCAHELGIKTIYKSENRPAYRLFQSSIFKVVIKQSEIKFK